LRDNLTALLIAVGALLAAVVALLLGYVRRLHREIRPLEGRGDGRG
jgi:hypothetical protein